MTGITTAATSFWMHATLVLKERSTGSTLTLTLTNRPVISTTTRCYPILQNVSSLGTKAGQYVPQPMSGSLTINNAPHSIGFERRFSDLLERYEIIDQPITVASGYNAPGTETAGAQVFYGRVLKLNGDVKSGSLKIDVITAPIPTTDVTKIVDSVSFPMAPSASLGKYIPLVFGDDIEAKPIRVTADGTDPAVYAYGINYGSVFEMGGIQSVKFKDTDGKYRTVASPASTTTAAFSSTGTDDVVIWYADEIVTPLITVSTSYVVTGGRWRVQKNAGAVTGEMEWHIYEGTQTASGAWKPKDEPIASASFDKANLTTGAGNADLDFTFDHPVLMSSDVGVYYLGFTQTTDGATVVGANAVYYLQHTVASTRMWTRDYTHNNKWKKFNDTSIPIYGLYGLVFTDFTTGLPTDATGLSYSVVSVAQRSTPANQVACDIDNIDFLLIVDGITDDSGGNITGSAGAVITKPHHVAALLGRVWNGSTWVAGSADDAYSTSAYSSLQSVLNSAGIYYRLFEGAFQSRTTVSDALNTLCENTACRIGQTIASGYGLVPWGAEIATTAVLTDENSRLVSFEQRGVESIVNDVRFYYGKSLQDLTLETGAASKEFKNYTGAIAWNSATGALQTALAGLSTTLYGKKPNAKQVYDFIADPGSAELLARYLMAVYAHPHWYAVVRAPLITFASLEVFNVAELLHPELPAYFGTSSAAKAAHYLGDEFVIDSVTYPKRAKRYRAVIEGRETDFNTTNTPDVILTCRLLLNYPNDPT